MASSATIVKLTLNVSDMNRHYYNSHQLTVALHPSETPERLMFRVLVFALHASESLSFTKGLSMEDEPDIWSQDLSGQIETWIELGQIDEKRIKKANSRAQQLWVYTYQPRHADIWWQKNQKDLARYDKLNVASIETTSEQTIEQLFSRNMDLQCSIDGDDIYLSTDDSSSQFHLNRLK